MEANKLRLLFFCVLFLAIFPTLRANIAQFDQVWLKRSQEAKKAAQQAFKSNPEEVADDFNKHVNKAVNGFNSTRRALAKYNGPCNATNPIDSCWRCDENWEKNRKKLADCVIGFGHGTTGGKDGEIYVVDDPSDDDLVSPKPGTLRHAVIQKEPLWIIFKKNMSIKLRAELLLTDNKTIDGRGANVHISDGAQITLQYVQNIIIHGLHIHDIKRASGGLIRDSMNHYGYRSTSDGDAISMFGATNVWIDHISMSNCDDGLVDAVEGSTAITISNCHMTHHNDVMLFGASDTYSGDKLMQITLAFNTILDKDWCRGCQGADGVLFMLSTMTTLTGLCMPLVGVHIPPSSARETDLLLQKTEMQKRDYAPESEWKKWDWRSEDDLMMNGAFFVESGNKVTNGPKTGITAKPGSFAASLTRFAGALKCEPNKEC
ncbi:Pectin lyase fold/virulence factor [Sesbania bispinosa]|nr:Pectin lyase fold/virulence factor [Sesbania bispinosa]